MSKSIGVISTSRADYSIYYPLLKQLQNDSAFNLKIIALGMHCSQIYGRTVETIIKDGFDVIECPDSLVFGNDKAAIVKSMGLTTTYMAEVLKNNAFDLIFCLGDRFEMYAAVSAVVPFCIPIAHIHGGELTEGAIDQKFRNGISKLADYHFVSCEKHLRRIVQMGAARERVWNIGSLGVESLLKESTYSLAEIRQRYNIDLETYTLLCTYHPVSVEPELVQFHVEELVKALEKSREQIVITRTNADTKGDVVYTKMKELEQRLPGKVFFVENLGRIGYASFMKYSGAMIGNSSSGIIEAASFNLPVVNIGNRQKGRETSENVIHCEENEVSILNAIKIAKSFRGRKFTNIYYAENSSLKICNSIKTNLALDYSFQDLVIS